LRPGRRLHALRAGGDVLPEPSLGRAPSRGLALSPCGGGRARRGHRPLPRQRASGAHALKLEPRRRARYGRAMMLAGAPTVAPLASAGALPAPGWDVAKAGEVARGYMGRVRTEIRARHDAGTGG